MMNTPTTILILCEHSMAFVRKPNLYDAMRAIIEEGVAKVAPDTNVGVVNFGNKPDDSCFWTSAGEFDPQNMYGERCLGVGNIYNAVNVAVGQYLQDVDSFVLVICTFCGPTDLSAILDAAVRQRINAQSRCAVIYADAQIHMPLSDLAITLDSMFTVGSDPEIARFGDFLRVNTATSTEHTQSRDTDSHQHRRIYTDDQFS